MIRRAPGPKFSGKWGSAGFFGLAAGLFTMAGVGLLVVMGWQSIPFLRAHRGLAEILRPEWNPAAGQFGLLPMVAGTVLVTLIATAVALPLAGGLAVVGGRLVSAAGAELWSQGLTVFAAVPSVVYGWWGLETVVPAVRHLGDSPGFSVLAAGIVLAVMMMPTMGLLLSRAVARVPGAWVEGSLALGATEDQTLWRLVWPAAKSDVGRGVLIAMARGAGETMAVQMVIGGQARLIDNVLEPGATLSTQILTDLTAFPRGTEAHSALWLMALLLAGLVYLLVWWGEGRGDDR